MRGIREQRGLDMAEVADFASIAADRLEQFESGVREPSRKQMEKLAGIYGVPLYVLFNDTIPNLPAPPTDFRKTDPAPAELSPAGVRSLLACERISQFAGQLAVELEYEPTDLSGQARDAGTVKERATALRRAFDDWHLPREEAFGFVGSSEQRFLSGLRLFLEVQGSIVNVNDAPSADFMGFFLSPAAGLPTIFINRSVSSKKAQLFTLAHEYCHDLLGQEGVSNPFRAKNAIERECNVFAAEFIAPMDDFRRTVERFSTRQRSDVDNFITAASSQSLLSKHAAAIRLVEGQYINQRQYQSWRNIFVSHPKDEKDEEKEAAGVQGGGQPHAKRIGELGYLPVFLAKQGIERQYIDSIDVVDGLRLSTKLQEKAFSLVARRFEVATS